MASPSLTKAVVVMLLMWPCLTRLIIPKISGGGKFGIRHFAGDVLPTCVAIFGCRVWRPFCPLISRRWPLILFLSSWVFIESFLYDFCGAMATFFQDFAQETVFFVSWHCHPRWFSVKTAPLGSDQTWRETWESKHVEAVRQICCEALNSFFFHFQVTTFPFGRFFFSPFLPSISSDCLQILAQKSIWVMCRTVGSLETCWRIIWMFPKIVFFHPKWMVYNGKPY